MTPDELHVELMTYRIVNWHIYAIIHAMIDAGQVTIIECQMPTCLMPSRRLGKEGKRNARDLLTLDHIIPRRDQPLHRLENLRLAHGTCNSSWRKGQVGSPMSGRHHTDEAKAKIGDAIKLLRAEHGPTRGTTGMKYSEETRRKQSVSIAAARALMTPEAKRTAALKAWETRRARYGVPG